MSQPENVIPMSADLPTPSAGASAPTKGEGEARKRKADKPFDFGRLNTLMADMVLIYGTLTAWDDDSRRIVAVNALRLAFGSDYVKAWLNADGRRMVKPEQIMFEPGRELAEPCINLFDGFAMEPAEGDCSPILELLHHLCSESADSDTGVEEVVTWALRWLALPLQRPGTKMRSAMVFHGPQGAGKNLLFEIVAAIYGKYALVVGQEQLEDKFNDWASQKLFLIGDEVVARQELYHQKNKLKAFITGETIQINTKMMPLRTESNHVNVVFLSNEQQPLALEVGDRRYFVVYTPPRRQDDLYKRVAACLAKGGAQAFMRYLMQQDLGAFTEFDIPPMTRAKADLIELGLKPHERFARDWVKGYLPLPLRVCSTEQLYRAFSRWARNTGERFPPPQVTFSKGVEKVLRDKVRCKGVKLDAEVNGRAWLRMWIPGNCKAPEGMTEGAWARSAVESFEGDLRDFGAGEGGRE
jgi:putative DNA primase/helicase